MGVYLYLLYIKSHNTHSNSRLKAFLQNGTNVAGLHTFKSVYEGNIWFKVVEELKLGLG